jgi:hypothetical protein
VPGGAPGLQNQCGAEKVPGGFDSHSPPPFLTVSIHMSAVRVRRIASGLLSLLGMILFGYGVVFHTVRVPDKTGLELLTKSEPELIKQIADTCPT